MKLGIISSWNEDGFSSAKSMGLSFVEFCVNDFNAPVEFAAKADEINTYIKKYGITVGSIGRWGSSRINEDGSINDDELKKDILLVETADKVKCPVYVLGCNYIDGKTYEENCQYAVNYISKVAQRGKELGVKVALYNCNWNSFVYEPKAWEIILPQIEGLGLKYDTSHAIYGGRNYLKEMRDWGDKFYHVHIKGALPIDSERYDDPPAGLDLTSWGAVIDILYTKEYQGGLSIEPHSKYWKEEKGQWGINFTIKYISQFLM